MTIGANVDVGKDAFDLGFPEYYKSINSKGGKYEYFGNSWRPDFGTLLEKYSSRKLTPAFPERKLNIEDIDKLIMKKKTDDFVNTTEQ